MLIRLYSISIGDGLRAQYRSFGVFFVSGERLICCAIKATSSLQSNHGKKVAMRNDINDKMPVRIERSEKHRLKRRMAKP